MMKVARLVVAVWLPVTLATAQALVLPPGYDTTEASSGGRIAGFEGRSRQQVVVRGADLRPIEARSIVAITFRRDRALGVPFQASTTVLRLQLSPARTTPLAPSSRFSSNAGLAPTTVFQGAVSLPSTPAVAGPVGWAAPYGVRLALSAPYPHVPGDLCIEIDGVPQSPPADFLWWVDYVQEAGIGTVVPFGRGCGLATSRNQFTADAWGRNIIPGGTFSLMTVGLSGTPAMLMLGTRLGSPVPLDSIGASGCSLYVQPLAALLGGFPPAANGLSFPVMYTDLGMPVAPALLGGRFWVQGANFETGASQSNPAGITTTNGLEITIAAGLPRGSMATIVSDETPSGPLPVTGRVDIGRGPVMRFEYQ